LFLRKQGFFLVFLTLACYTERKEYRRVPYAASVIARKAFK